MAVKKIILEFSVLCSLSNDAAIQVVQVRANRHPNHYQKCHAPHPQRTESAGQESRAAPACLGQSCISVDSRKNVRPAPDEDFALTPKAHQLSETIQGVTQLPSCILPGYSQL